MADSLGNSLPVEQGGVVYSNSKPGHLGLPGDSASAKGGLGDFFMMGLAHKIYSASAYSWGSGFSLAASQLFDVPLVSPQPFSTRQPNHPA